MALTLTAASEAPEDLRLLVNLNRSLSLPEGPLIRVRVGGLIGLES